MKRLEQDLKDLRDLGQGAGVLTLHQTPLPQGLAASSAEIIASLNEQLIQALQVSHVTPKFMYLCSRVKKYFSSAQAISLKPRVESYPQYLVIFISFLVFHGCDSMGLGSKSLWAFLYFCICTMSFVLPHTVRLCSANHCNTLSFIIWQCSIIS